MGAGLSADTLPSIGKRSEHVGSIHLFAEVVGFGFGEVVIRECKVEAGYQLVQLVSGNQRKERSVQR